MTREQVEWHTKQYDKAHRRQRCTYYSVVNINKVNYPYSSSFERKQTWTLTSTMSNQQKRYQSSIENIHLTIPSVLTIVAPYSSNTDSSDYENEKIKLDRSVSLLPPVPPSRQHGLISHRLNRFYIDSKDYQQQTMTNNHFNTKPKSIIKKSQTMRNPMRIMHVNGEYVVRI